MEILIRKESAYLNIIKWIVKISKVDGIVWLLQNTHDMTKYRAKLTSLSKLPTGTVGRELALLLYENRMELIPKFEDHDLKHLLLEYEMNPVDEIKMQAFLLGNGNYTLPCVLFLSLGLFMPTYWSAFKQEYKRGRRAKSVLHLTIENCSFKNLMNLKRELELI